MLFKIGRNLRQNYFVVILYMKGHPDPLFMRGCGVWVFYVPNYHKCAICSTFIATIEKLIYLFLTALTCINRAKILLAVV